MMKGYAQGRQAARESERDAKEIGEFKARAEREVLDYGEEMAAEERRKQAMKSAFLFAKERQRERALEVYSLPTPLRLFIIMLLLLTSLYWFLTIFVGKNSTAKIIPKDYHQKLGTELPGGLSHHCTQNIAHTTNATHQAASRFHSASSFSALLIILPLLSLIFIFSTRSLCGMQHP